MAFSFRCPLCHAERQASEKIAGRRVRCPECSQLVTVAAKGPKGSTSSWDWDDMQRDTQYSIPALGNDTTLPPEPDTFDPYYEWLAISKANRPANYYQLLGINTFEADRHVISIATDRQMAHVKAQASGKNGRWSQPLLNELAKASSCLLDPQEKAAYDERLRAELQPAPSSPPEPSSSPTETSPTETSPTETSAPPPAHPEPPPPPAAAPGGDAPAAPAPPRPAGSRTIVGFAPVDIAADDAAVEPERGDDPIDAPPGGNSYDDNGDADDRRLSPQPVTPPPPPPPAVPSGTAADQPISFGGKETDRESEMDMTPMVDVTFLLLIFFMVTASFTLQKSIETPAQEKDEPSTEVKTLDDFEDNLDYVVVRVDEYNTYLVIYAGWDDSREAPSQHELIRLLRRAREGVSDGGTFRRPTRMLVAAHGDAHHETVVKAMDAGNEVGMEQTQVVLSEEDDY